MRAAAGGRWALSFADLCLVLLGFFVLIQARAADRTAVTGSVAAAFGAPASTSESRAAAAMFEPGEAVLRPAARLWLATLARGRSHARVESVGRDAGAGRFDGWELAAARTAAAARALGLPAERVEVVMPAIDGPATGQRIAVTIR